MKVKGFVSMSFSIEGSKIVKKAVLIKCSVFLASFWLVRLVLWHLAVMKLRHFEIERIVEVEP